MPPTPFPFRTCGRPCSRWTGGPARQVIVYWFAGVPSWERIRVDLYPRIFGQEHICHPICDVLYNLLYSLWIYADVQVLQETAFPRIYESLEGGSQGCGGPWG